MGYINEVILIEYQYFGNVNYYFELINSKYCKFDEYVGWRKSSFSNRCRVLGSNGPIDLSIPLVGGRDQKVAFNEVGISEKYDWKTNHWKTIVSCYSRSPWFEYYKASLELLYKKKETSIISFLKSCEKWVEIQLKVQITGKEIFESLEWENIKDLRFMINPAHPFLEERSIITYPQVFEERLGFVPHLSILDLLFCEGPNALNKLSMRKY